MTTSGSSKEAVPNNVRSPRLKSRTHPNESLMKALKFSLLNFSLAACAVLAAVFISRPASAQLVAYDDAGNYLVTANWTNGANQGFGFTPWVIVTNGPDFSGTFITTVNNPTFVIADVTNVLGTSYT